MAEDKIKYPLIELTNLSIDSTISSIKGLAYIYSVSYDSNFNQAEKKKLLESDFSLPYSNTLNFQQQLKIFCENLVLKYFIEQHDLDTICYDYFRMTTSQNEEKENSSFIGSTKGFFYVEKEREVI